MQTNNSQNIKDEIRARARKRRRTRFIIIASIAAFLVAAIVAGIILLVHFRTYSSYEIQSSIDLNSSSDDVTYEEYSNGYIQCAADGITYFNSSGVIWDQEFSMTQPILDVCGNYIAVADMKQAEVYLFDRSGLLKRIATGHEILDVQVSENGVVALATSSGSSNYIELRDKDGNELVNVKSIFSSSGYLTDIGLSDDGTKLAAAFLYVSEGSIVSKVQFYDFSKTGDSADTLVGTFDHYTDTLITDVEFMKGNVVCAVGDNALTFYRFSGTPKIISEELELEWEIQTLKIKEKNLLVIIKETSDEASYRAIVYNTSGKQIASQGFDFSYRYADVSGRNILLYSQTSFRLISFAGIERLSYTFDESVRFILPRSASRYILTSAGTAHFIELK